MRREMNYRDKMILLIIGVIVILAVGIFALFRPKYKAYQQDKITYQDTKTEWEGIDAKLQQIEPLKKSIKTTRDEAARTADLFVNENFDQVNKTWENKKQNYSIDMGFFQPMIDEAEIEVTAFAVEDVSAKTIGYYYYEPDVVTYALLESGDINGAYAKEIGELLEESIVLSEVEEVEMMAQSIAMSLVAKKENLMNFLNAVKANKEAVIVDTVSIADYNFLGGLETDEEGNIIIPDGEEEANGTSEVVVGISFYNAKPIDTPVYD